MSKMCIQIRQRQGCIIDKIIIGMDNFKRRRLNTEILTKTQIVSQALLRHSRLSSVTI